MLFDDELDPRKQPKKPRDLSPFSVEELDAYIASLRDEIARAEAEKARKTTYLATASTFFKAKE